MLNPFSRLGRVWKDKALWKKVTLFTKGVRVGGRKERKSVELAGNRAEGWKELAQLFISSPAVTLSLL